MRYENAISQESGIQEYNGLGLFYTLSSKLQQVKTLPDFVTIWWLERKSILSASRVQQDLILNMTFIVFQLHNTV
jgi:hypothetical protein